MEIKITDEGYEAVAKDLSPMQKAYREFFLSKMEEHGIASPFEDESTAIKFFNEIKKEWPAKRAAVSQ